MKTNTFKPLRFGPSTQASERIIPSEQLTEFTPWQPGLLGPAPTLQAQQKVKPSGPSPEEITAQVEAARTQGLHEGRSEGHRTGHAEGLEQGLQQGTEALEQFRQEHARQQAERISTVVAQWQQQLDQLQVEAAEQLAHIALALARQVVRSELSQRPQLVVDVVQEALAALITASQAITLRVHPDDHPIVSLGAQEALEARKARLIADPTIEPGGCLVESDIARIDATVATRWERAAAAIGRESAWADEADASDSTLPQEPA